MKTICIGAVILLTAVPTCLEAQFATEVIEYHPGVGYATEFGSGLGYTNTGAILGAPSRVTPGEFASPVEPFSAPYLREQLLSLGTGGIATLRFDAPLRNHPNNPFGLDFIIFGSSGFVITNGDYSGGGITDGSIFGNNTGSARVSVSTDGATFFTLDPSQAPGFDSLFPTDGQGDFARPVPPGLSYQDFAGANLDTIRSLYSGSGGGTAYDLDWARDSEGRTLDLDQVQFLRLEVLSGRAEVDAIGGINPVPEPATWALILGGSLFLRWSHLRRSTAALALLLLLEPHSRASQFFEDFATDPASRGWKVAGNSELFRWDAPSELMAVTWDSTQPNAYLFHDLPRIVTEADSFQFEFAIELVSIAAGVAPGKPGTFQIAVGLHRHRDALQPGFIRGTGTGSPNLVEWNYFPDTGFGATISPVLVSSNGRFNAGFTFPLELEPGLRYRVNARYSARDRTLFTELSAPGRQLPPIASVVLAPDSAGFEVDAFAVASYSDAGQSGDYAGSVLAMGLVDDVRFVLEEVHSLPASGQFVKGEWQVTLSAEAGIRYALDRCSDLGRWETLTTNRPTTSGAFRLVDSNPPAMQGFYRVRALGP